MNGNATTTSAGAISTASTLTVTGASTFTGATTHNGAVTLGDAIGDNITVTGNATTSNSLYVTSSFSVGDNASTTKLIVGGDAAAGTLAGLIFGTCNLTERALTASTTGGFACTGATGVTTAFKVFVMATSSLLAGSNPPEGFAIVGASSTAVNTIGVQITNLSNSDITPDGTLNFWAVR